MATVANCEAPGGYNYNRPQSFGGGVSSGGNALASGGNYEQEAIGASTNEGLTVDPQLLEQIKQILLREESKSSSGGNGNGGGNFGAPSSQYGAPAPQYGPPAQSQARVVGIVLENTQPAIQVAQFRAQSQEAGGYAPSSGGYPSGPASPPSSSYGAPAPSRPSSSYGAPSY